MFWQWSVGNCNVVVWCYSHSTVGPERLECSRWLYTKGFFIVQILAVIPCDLVCIALMCSVCWDPCSYFYMRFCCHHSVHVFTFRYAFILLGRPLLYRKCFCMRKCFTDKFSFHFPCRSTVQSSLQADLGKPCVLRWLRTILMWLLQQQLTMQLLASC